MPALSGSRGAWAESHDAVVAYGHHLVHVHAVSAEALLEYFESPWKWPGDKVRKDADGEDWCPECSDAEKCDGCGDLFPGAELVNGPPMPLVDGEDDGVEWRKCRTCAGGR